MRIRVRLISVPRPPVRTEANDTEKKKIPSTRLPKFMHFVVLPETRPVRTGHHTPVSSS